MVKVRHRRELAALLIGAAGLAIVLMDHFYFQYVSQQVYKMFLLAGIVLIVWLFCRLRRQSRKKELEMQCRELMFDALSSSVEDIFLMLDSSTWKVDYLSPNVERLLGISPDAAAADIRLLGDAADGGFIDREAFSAIPIGGSRHWEREHTHQSTGERRWYRESVCRESIQGAEKFVIVMSDRTQERQMTENLQHALDSAKSANEAKSSFLANMSHDIRTPMNAILGLAVLLAKDADNAEKVREYTRKISASGQHLLGLINDVLDMSKIESGKTSLNIAQFSLPELLEELYTILIPQARDKRQSFQFHVQGCPAELLMGDKLRLNQILINLLSNSIKYTPEGGAIDFTVQGMPQPSPHHACLHFIIQDNGIGMSEEFLKTVFDPFSREASAATAGIQGTGLGMAITKNLAELMGGKIDVASQLNQGSTFTVELTFTLADPPDGDAVWARQGISRVLVADDDENVCQNIQTMMGETDVAVSCVTSGAAVDLAVSAQERGEGFDAVLLDWKMPGQSGVETARRLRERLEENIPIFVLTSYDWSDIEDEARAAGVDAFIPKPFFVSTFQQALENLEARKGQNSASEEEEDSSLEGLLLLVAEDNELNAEILSEMLDMEGARCELASNGQEVLDMFSRSKPGYYDMILMDVQMPVMDGYEATHRIRACGHPRAGSIPIVAMTANAFAEDVRTALDAGMDAHLSKPIDMDALKALLGRLRNSEVMPGKKKKKSSGRKQKRGVSVG